MPVTISPNMNLPVPVVEQEPGPQWASDLNACLALVDSHSHIPGSGIPITPSGLNLNSDLTFQSHNAYALRSARFTSQDTPIAEATDLGCVYVTGVDLYYNDINGNQIQITQAGGVAGSPGSISNLTSPASASYDAGSSTFIWQSDANTPANMDLAALVLRNLVANSKSLTVSPPAAMAADYGLVLPTIPASLQIVTCDVSGNLTASMSADETSLTMSTTQLSIKDLGVTTAKIAAGAVTGAKIASATIQHSNMAILRPTGFTRGTPFTSTSAAYASTGLTVSITPVGSVVTGNIFNGTLTMQCLAPFTLNGSATYKWVRLVGGVSTEIAEYDYTPGLNSALMETPGGGLAFLDTGATAGASNNYTLWVRCNNAQTQAGISSSTVYVYEL